MKEKKLPVIFGVDDIGVALLESITSGLYEDPLIVIREYVQNSYDANPKEVTIFYDENDSTFVIKDNGSGMDKEDILIAKKIGISNKSNEQVGFRGIGIYAGLAVADEIKIITTKKGCDKKYTLHLECDKIKEEQNSRVSLVSVMNDYVHLSEIDCNIDESYTEVYLKINKNFRQNFLDELKIKRFIGLSLPTDFDPKFKFSTIINEKLKENIPNYVNIKIRYSGDFVYKPCVDFLEDPKFGLISDGTKDYAFYWACINKNRGKIKNQDVSGMIFKMKGFTIGDRSTSKELFISSHLMDWITGEIHIINDDIIPNASRDYFEFNESYTKFENLIKTKLRTDLERYIRNKSDRENAEKVTIDGIKRFKEINESFNELNTIEKALKKKELDDIYNQLEYRRSKLIKKDIIEDSKKASKEITNLTGNESIKDSDILKKKIIKEEEEKEMKKEETIDLFDKILGNPRLHSQSKEILKISNEVLVSQLSEKHYFEILDSLLKRIIKECKL